MYDEERLRGTGRTTNQMREAPVGAVYVVPGKAAPNYFQDLAKRLGRFDLMIVPTSQIDDRFRWAGRKYTGVILDHAVKLTPAQEKVYNEMVVVGVR